MPGPGDPFFGPQMSGYGPIAQGWPSTQFTGMGPLPMPWWMQMASQPFMAGMMSKYGYVPVGTSTQNVFDSLQQLRFTQAQMEIMRQASEADRAQYQQLFKALPGGMGPQLANFMVSTSPILAPMMPRLLDDLTGGSAATMSYFMSSGGRYRVDPITGLMGMSANTQGQVAQGLINDLYRNGNIQATSGIRAGEAGQLFDQLQRRGLIKGVGSPLENVREAVRVMDYEDPRGLRNIFSESGVTSDANSLTPEDFNKLLGNTNMQSKIRSLDMQKIKSSLEDYSKAVSAVGDLFTSTGGAEAPMDQILNALEKLSRGRMHSMDPTRLGEMVRSMTSGARIAGIDPAAAMAVQEHAAMMASSLGIKDPTIGLRAATGAFSGLPAWNNTFGGLHVYGTMSGNEAFQSLVHSQISAERSTAAKRAGVMMRIQETIGFAGGSEAAQYAADVAAGRPRAIGVGDMMRMIRESGIDLDEGTVRGMISQPATAEFVSKHNIGPNLVLSGEQARADLYPRINRYTANSLEALLRRQGVSPDEARRIAGVVSPQLAAAWRDLTPEQRANSPAALQGTFRELMAAQGIDMTMDMSRMQLEGIRGDIDRQVQRGVLSHYGGFEDVLRAGDPKFLATADQMRQQAAIEANMAESFAPLRGGPLSRVAAAIRAQSGEGTVDVGAILSSVAGIDKSQIAHGLEGQLNQLSTLSKEYEDLKAQWKAAEGNPQEQARIRQLLNAKGKQLGTLSGELSRIKNISGLMISEEESMANLSPGAKHLVQQRRIYEAYQEAMKSGDNNEAWEAVYTRLTESGVSAEEARKRVAGFRGKNGATAETLADPDKSFSKADIDAATEWQKRRTPGMEKAKEKTQKVEISGTVKLDAEKGVIVFHHTQGKTDVPA